MAGYEEDKRNELLAELEETRSRVRALERLLAPDDASDACCDPAELRRAEEAARRSEAYLQAVFASTQDLICTRDVEGRLVSFNPAFAQFVLRSFGCPARPGLCTMRLLSESRRRYWERILRQVLNGTVHQQQFSASLEGVVHWYDITLVPIVRDGEIIGTAEFTHDITELKTSEEANRLKANLLQKAEKLAELGAWEWDIRSDIWRVSENWQRIHGVDNATLSSEELMALAHPEDCQAIAEAFRHSVEEGCRFSMHHRILRRDTKELRHIQSFGEVERCPKTGKLLRLAGAALDVTDRVLDEQQLRLLTRAIEQSGEMIMITNSCGDMQYVNPQFTAVTGYTEQEVLGRNPRMLSSGQTAQRVYEDLWATITSGRTWKGEFHNRKKNGEEYWEAATISPVVDDDGETVHYLAVKEDVTQHKRMEELKEDVERIMRHDLKTPLHGIIGLPEVMLQDTNLTPEQRQILHLIIRSGRKMLDMVNLSMTMFQIERDAYVSRPEVFDLLTVVHQAVADLTPLAQGKQVRILLTTRGRAASRPEQLWVQGEQLLASSVIANLLKNAVEASPVEACVELTLEDGEAVRLDIHNRGLVPEDLRPRFFEKYTTTGKLGGTGLGTYSAQLFARAQGWRVTMRSTEASGTVLSVLIPQASAGRPRNDEASGGWGDKPTGQPR